MKILARAILPALLLTVTAAAAVTAVPGLAWAAVFSLLPISDTTTVPGGSVSFEVFYTAAPGDETALAANLRLNYTFSGAADPRSVVTISGNTDGNPFQVPTQNLAANAGNPFLPQNVVDVGGAQFSDTTVDATGGVKLGELTFMIENDPSHLGTVTLGTGHAQTGSRSRTFQVIPDQTPDVLATISIEPDPTGVDCGPDGLDCTQRIYGLGTDIQFGSSSVARGTSLGPECGGMTAGLDPVPVRGQVTLLENENLSLPRSVEITGTGTVPSGYIYAMLASGQDPIGAEVLATRGAVFVDLSGSRGRRELAAHCSLDSNQRCSQDSDCASGSGCRGVCFASGLACVGDADCDAGLPGDTCGTRIVWDPDGSGPEGEQLQHRPDSRGALCCASESGGGCSALGLGEYPLLDAAGESVFGAPVRTNPGVWTFAGGPGTSWEQENVLIENQQFGTCSEAPAVGCESDADCATTCDLSEGGLRFFGATTLGDPAGSPDSGQCNAVAVRLRGIANFFCSFPESYNRDGDPQLFCRLPNFGTYARPDLDCNGIDDTAEGRCAPDGFQGCLSDEDCGGLPCIQSGDTCPYYSEEAPFADANADGRGDECQCGDANQDGAITGIDIAGAALCASDPASCDLTLTDATGDHEVTADDLADVSAVTRGSLSPTSLMCLREERPVFPFP